MTLTYIIIVGCQSDVEIEKTPPSTGGGSNDIATLSFDAGSLETFAATSTSSTRDKLVLITNLGLGTATNISGSFTNAGFDYKGGSFPGTAGTCGSNLAGEDSCYVILTYAPPNSNTHTSTFTLSYNHLTIPKSVALELTGSGLSSANINFSEASPYSIGTTVANGSNGVSLTQIISVTNSGGFAATSVDYQGLTNPFSIVNDSDTTCDISASASVLSGETCNLKISFSPSSVNSFSDTLNVNFFDGESSQTTSLVINGTSTQAASLEFSDGPVYNFGNNSTGNALTKQLTLSNIGSEDATSVLLGGLADPYSITSHTCGSTISAGGSCLVDVRYLPTTVNTFSDNVTVDYNDGVESQTGTRGVTGNSVSQGVLTISQTNPIDLGTRIIDDVVELTYVVENSGGSSVSSITSNNLNAPYSYKGGTFPGTGGTCSPGGTLAVSGSCTIVLTYTPAVSGTESDSIIISYNDGSSSKVMNHSITAEAATKANVSIAVTGDGSDFGILSIGTDESFTFTVSNSGETQATSLSGAAFGLAHFKFEGGTFPGTSGTCSTTLNAGSSCFISVTFEPSASGNPHNDTITLNYNTGLASSTATRAITGVARSPADIEISGAPTYAFGTQTITTVTDNIFTVSNNGESTATTFTLSGLTGTFSFKDGSYPGTGGDCGNTLSGGDSCTVVVSFSPTVAGSFSDDLEASFNNGVSDQVVSVGVTGTSLSKAELTLNQTDPIDLGTVIIDDVLELTYTLENTGGSAATGITPAALSDPYSFKGGTYPGTGGTCVSGDSLAASETCTIIVNYIPTVTGTDTETLSFDYNDGADDVTFSIGITADTQTKASLSIAVTGDGNDFGIVSIGANDSFTFTVSNSGETQATSLSGAAFGLAHFKFEGGTFPGTSGTCSTTLNAGSSCFIEVTFEPSASGNPHNDTITVNYNTGLAGSTATQAITGIARTPADISISSSPSYDYGAKTIGTVTDNIFTITNDGESTATGFSVSGIAGSFTFKDGSYPGTGGDCGNSLDGGDSCTVVVSYSPTGVGSFSDDLEVNYTDGVTTQVDSIEVEGTGLVSANIVINSENDVDFGLKANTLVTEITLNVENSGGAGATAVTADALSAPFSYKGGTYPGDGGDCSTSIGIGVTCTIVLEYEPTVTGTHNDTLTINYFNGGATVSSSISLDGTSAPAATLEINSNVAYDFGDVAQGSSNEVTLTVTNTGLAGGIEATQLADDSSLSTAHYTYKDGSYPGTGGDCGNSLAATASCTLVIILNPSATGQPLADTIDLNFDNGLGEGSANTEVTLSVTADVYSTVALTISDNAHAYGTYATSTNKADNVKTFTVSNPSAALSATSMTVSLLTGTHFSIITGSSTCDDSATLAAGATCTLTVEFDPSTTGNLSDTLTVSYVNGTAATNVQNTISGVGANPAAITLTPTPSNNFGTVAETTDGSNGNLITFTLNNTGGVTATNIALSGADADFATYGVYPGSGGDCTTELTASSSCTIIIEYSPDNTGSDSALFTLSYDNENGTVGGDDNVVQLVSGVAVVAASLSISDNAYNFGSYATNTNKSDNTKTFTVTNNSASLAVENISVDMTNTTDYTISNNTCGATLGTSSSCTFDVTFDPQSTGALNSTLEIDYNDGTDNSANQTLSNTIGGTGVNPAVLTMTATSSGNYGTVAVDSDADDGNSITITVANAAGTATATNMSFSGLLDPYTIQSNACTSTLSAGATCDVVVVFAPSSINTFNDSLILDYDDENGVVGGDDQDTEALTGISVAKAVLTITGTDPEDYGTYSTNTSATDNVKLFTITHDSGGVDATSINITGLASPFVFSGAGYPGTNGDCDTDLTLAETCTIEVRFLPLSASDQVHDDTLIVNWNDGTGAGSSNQNVQRDLRGTEVVPGILTITPDSSNDYGSVARGSDFGDGSNRLSFTVENDSNFAVTSVVPSIVTGTHYTDLSHNCAGTMNINDSCTVTIDFEPSANGVHNDNLRMSYHNGSEATTTDQAITGTAVDPITLSLSADSSASYGDFATNTTLTTNVRVFTLTNNSSALAVSNFDFSGIAAPFDWAGGSYPGASGGGTCGSTLPASGTCKVAIRFLPTSGTEQNHTDDIVVDFDDGTNDGANNAQTTLSIDGDEKDPAELVFQAASGDFGTVARGSDEDDGNSITFTVENTGGVPATSFAIGLATDSIYQIDDGDSTCDNVDSGTGIMAVGATCTITVYFSPVANGTPTDTIEVDYNNEAAVTQTTKALNATVVDPASLTYTGTSFGQVYGDFSEESTITITNAGGVQAGAMSGSGLAAPFSFKDGSYPGTGGDCDTTLNAGATCTIVVVFAPTVSGAAFNDNVVIGYYDGTGGGAANRNSTETLSGQNNWGRRIQVTFDNSGQGSDLTDFPVLVSISAGPGINYSNFMANGEDVRFLDADGNLLAHDIEMWDSSGTSHIWVNVPLITGGSNSDYIYMYYDYNAAANGDNESGTWASDYISVWHMHDEDAAGAPTVLDSTTNNSDFDGQNGLTVADIQTGKFGRAVRFEGGSEQLTASTMAGKINGLNAFTVSTWVKKDAADTDDFHGIFICETPTDDATDSNNFNLIQSAGNSNFSMGLTGTGTSTVTSANNTQDTNWVHLAVTWSSTNGPQMYVNGVASGAAGAALVGPISSCNSFILGRGSEDYANEGNVFFPDWQEYSFIGLIDETRISNEAKSADWIAAEYLSGNGSFVILENAKVYP